MIKQSKFISGVFEIYRCRQAPTLVYLRTLKCASTYYATFFEKQHWIKDTADNINWGTDHVFSFISNPDERRLKGLTQYIFGSSKTELLEQDENFWASVPYLDLHSLPYTISYGDFVNLIDWIPLDQPGSSITATQMLVRLFEKHNVYYAEYPSQQLNESGPEQLKMYERIKAKSNAGNSAVTQLVLEKDRELYNNVCRFIQPWMVNWDEITWLIKR